MQTLRDLRKQSGKSCAEVAQELGVTTAAVRNYEQGIRTISIEKIKPLANLYDVSVEEIIDSQINTLKVRQTN